MPLDFVMPLARRPCRPLLRRSLSLLAALLVACGGGGGSSDTPPLDASVSFTATDLDFSNPERGMTRSLDALATASDSQLATLQPLQPDEDGIVLDIRKPLPVLLEQILQAARLDSPRPPV